MNWTPEPWEASEAYKRTDISYIFAQDHLAIAECCNNANAANAQRIIKCVNALAGIADPAACLQGIYNALMEIEREGQKMQFAPNDLPEFRARRIQQIARAARQSLGEVYFNTQKVQEPALSEDVP